MHGAKAVLHGPLAGPMSPCRGQPLAPELAGCQAVLSLARPRMRIRSPDPELAALLHLPPVHAQRPFADALAGRQREERCSARPMWGFAFSRHQSR